MKKCKITRLETKLQILVSKLSPPVADAVLSDMNVLTASMNDRERQIGYAIKSTMQAIAVAPAR